MKVKAFFLTTSLTATLFMARQGQVSGFNIVGYINADLPANTWSFIANPLDNGSMAITNVFQSGAPDGTAVALWDVTNGVWQPFEVYHVGSGWVPGTAVLPLGRGFAIKPPQHFINTFVGTVPQGSLTNLIAGSNHFSLVACITPITVSLSAMTFPGADGDNVWFNNTSSGSYGDAFSYFHGYGWFDPNGLVGTNGPKVSPAQAFWVQHPGANTNWVLNFVVNLIGSSGPEIRRLAINGGQATILVRTNGQPYNVQFSTDRISWSNIATNQTAVTWTGPLPGGSQGYFQLINP